MASRISDPRIAVTELQIFVQGLAYPTNSTMAEALFFSGILHSCIRQGDLVEMITHSALVNHGGGLRKYKEIVYPNPVHWAHHLYGNQPGSRPVRLDVRCAQFSVPRRIWPAVEAVPYLDPVALLDESGDVLCVIVSNRHPERALKASIVLHGFESEHDVKISQIKADSFISRNTLDEPDKVRLTESSARIDATRLTYTFPAHSLTALQFRR
jgi:alpha-N-arabinofuranosidase